MPKKFFRKRYIVYLIAIIVLIIINYLNITLPIGPGSYNQKQIDKIEQTKSSNQFSFVVMGDNKNSFHTFKQILQDTDKENYLFAINLGDLIFNGRKIEYRSFFNMIDNEKIPYLVAPGNHDVRNKGAKYYQEIFGPLYYSFDYANSLFIVLDNSDEKQIDATQITWLEQELQRDFQHKFVFMHVPPFDPRSDGNNGMKNKQNAQTFMALMEKYKPDIVFGSHIHAYYDETKDDINCRVTLGSPETGKDGSGPSQRGQ